MMRAVFLLAFLAPFPLPLSHASHNVQANAASWCYGQTIEISFDVLLPEAIVFPNFCFTASLVNLRIQVGLIPISRM